MKIAFLLAAWGIFFILANKVASIEVTHNEYDPYAILGLDTVAKAYQALTDDEARQNWEKYGNPDGPTATTFGIALPKWLVSKEYGDDESQSSGSEEPAQSGGDQDDSDVDEDWAKPPKNIFESKSKETHPVHAPFYPGEKFEWWWLSLTLKDHKQHRRLVAPVTPCKTLVDSQTIEMRFNAPDEKGIYTFTLGVHSDSYMDADYSRDLKLDVKETKIVAAPKYESTDDEEEEKADASSEEEYTEESDDE
ncbi:unnamed protein product, partial [Mesorhabditis spiculigera]